MGGCSGDDGVDDDLGLWAESGCEVVQVADRAPSRLRLGVALGPAPSMGRSPVVARAPSPWKFRIPPAIPGGTLLNPTAPEEQGLAALREGDKPESRANGKEPMNFKPLTTTTMPTTSTPTALALTIDL